MRLRGSPAGRVYKEKVSEEKTDCCSIRIHARIARQLSSTKAIRVYTLDTSTEQPSFLE